LAGERPEEASNSERLMENVGGLGSDQLHSEKKSRQTNNHLAAL